MKKDDIELEKKMLSLMIQNQHAIKIIIEKTTIDFLFYDKCKEVYRCLKDYYDKYISLPSKIILEEFIKSQYTMLNIDEILLFIAQLRKEKVNIIDLDFIIDQLRNYKLLREYLNILDKYTQNISSANINKIYGKLEEELLTIKESNKAIDLRRFEMNNVIENRIMRYSELQSKNEFKIPSGYSVIDEKIGGWRLSWLIVVTAESGAGKSITLLNLAENANLLGKVDVIYISLEMPYEEYLDRYHALITGINHDVILNKKFTREQKRKFIAKIMMRSIIPEQHEDFRIWFKKQKIDDDNLLKTIHEFQKIFKKISQKLYFLDIPRNCNVLTIEKELKHIMRFCNPKVVIIDYINIMESLSKTGIQAYDHGIIAKELKGLAREMNITIITASQMLITKDNRLGLDKVKYARMIAENADYVLMFKQTEEDEMMERIRLRLVKHRHSKDMTITLRKEFDTMKLANYHEIKI